MEEQEVCKCTVTDSLFSVSEIICLKSLTCSKKIHFNVLSSTSG